MSKQPATNPFEFVVVFGPDNWEQNEDVLFQYRHIYEEAFPNPNEREDYESEIVPRLKAGAALGDGSLQTIAVFLKGPDGLVAGGMIADWYPKVNSLEIIYLAVLSSARWSEGAGAKNLHLGSTLLSQGTDRICEYLKNKEGKSVRRKDIYLFFEAENPFHPDNINCQQQAIGRLRFFSKCGAVRIPINYVQPPLDKFKGYSRNLFLFLIPDSKGRSRDGIPYRDLTDFVVEFYKGLKDRASDPAVFKKELDTLTRHIKDVANEKDLVPFDSLEEQTSADPIHDIAISTHYEMKDTALPKSILDREAQVCPQWGSYESDLLNFAGQENAPFCTHFADLRENVLLPLPAVYSYTSEGRTYCKLCSRDRVAVDVSVSWSLRRMGGGQTRIAHVTVAPHKGDAVLEADSGAPRDAGDSFSVLDVIKIIAGMGFGSKQEGYTTTEDDRRRFEGFFRSLLQDCFPGCSQFVPSGLGCSEVNLHGYKSDKSLAEKIRCGVLLGIFDFERMSPVESEVTLQPIYEYNDLVYYVSRGHLMRIKNRAKEDDERLENLLISPYLLIPSAALCLNGILLDLAHRKMSKRWLPGATAKAKKMLTTDMLTDVFQYKSERQILMKVMVGRSLARKQKEYISLCEMKQARTIHLMEAVQAMLLALMALFQIRNVFDAHHALFWVLFGVLAAFFLFYVVLRWKE